MKTSPLIILMSALSLFIFSCNDACDDVNCNNQGICDDGNCECDEGYEGAACENEVNTKFLGEWESLDYICTDGDLNPVEFIIEKGNSIKELLVINANSPEVRLVGNIEANKINFMPQTISTVTYQGCMTLGMDELTLDIGVELEDGSEFVCTGSASKK